MKKVMMRCLLLVAAMGYFFAGLHTAKHLHLPHDAAIASSHSTPHQAADSSAPDTAEADDCPICIVHSHALIALLPPDDIGFSATYPDPEPLSSTVSLTGILNDYTLGARAPPIV